MRVWVALAALCVTACGSDPPPPAVAPTAPAPTPAPAPPPPPEEKEDDIPDTPADEEPAPVIPEVPAAAPSTASFEQATATPEPIRKDDDHLHLTDNQLSGPMRGVLVKCKVPANTKVTIKTAVQFGHAIGVTVIVDMPKLKEPKKPSKKSKAAAAARAKTVKRITTCADQAVRALTWPPSRRRDAFTTTF